MSFVVIDGLRVEDMERPGLATVRAGGVFFDRARAVRWSAVPRIGLDGCTSTGAPGPRWPGPGAADPVGGAPDGGLRHRVGRGWNDGPRAAGLVSGTDWTARPGRGERAREPKAASARAT